jgi:peptide/nickel transport system permease protein
MTFFLDFETMPSIISTGVLFRKLVRYAISLLAIIVLVFAIPHGMSGNPVLAFVGEDMEVTPAYLDSMTVKLGLDKPIHEQFLEYVRGIFNGDLGYSYHRASNVSDLIMERLPWTVSLALVSMFIGYSASIIFGAYAGWRSEKPGSKILTFACLIISCFPSFILGLLFYSLFVYSLGWFPLKGYYSVSSTGILDIMWHMALPVAILSLFTFTGNLLLMRGSIITEKNQLYPQFAASLGIPERQILLGHVMKNAILPVLTHVTMAFGGILSGALIIEIIFTLNGMGLLMYKALQSYDYPILCGLLFVFGVMTVLANIAADILYGVVDKRVWSEDK